MCVQITYSWCDVCCKKQDMLQNCINERLEQLFTLENKLERNALDMKICTKIWYVSDVDLYIFL